MQYYGMRNEQEKHNTTLLQFSYNSQSKACNCTKIVHSAANVMWMYNFCADFGLFSENCRKIARQLLSTRNHAPGDPESQSSGSGTLIRRQRWLRGIRANLHSIYLIVKATDHPAVRYCAEHCWYVRSIQLCKETKSIRQPTFLWSSRECGSMGASVTHRIIFWDYRRIVLCYSRLFLNLFSSIAWPDFQYIFEWFSALHRVPVWILPDLSASAAVALHHASHSVRMPQTNVHSYISNAIDFKLAEWLDRFQMMKRRTHTKKLQTAEVMRLRSESSQKASEGTQSALE